MNLKSAIEEQTRNRAAQQTLATGERRIALAEDKQQFDEGQIPWATAGGALSAGVQLYGGYRAIEDANAVKARLDKRDALDQAHYANMKTELGLQTGYLKKAMQVQQGIAPYAPYTKGYAETYPLG